MREKSKTNSKLKKYALIASIPILVGSGLTAAVENNYKGTRNLLEETVSESAFERMRDARLYAGAFLGENYFPEKVTEIVEEVYNEINQPLPDYLTKDFVLRIIRQESGYNPDAISNAGAKGLMQLTPSAFKDAEKELGKNLEKNNYDIIFEPKINVNAGINYLKWIDDYWNDKDPNWVSLDDSEKMKIALASYHAGAFRIHQLDRDITELPLTRKYVANIVRDMGR